MSLDDIDARIVTALIKDARASYAVIGNEVDLSAPAVKRRVDRLRASGAITGVSARVDPAALGWPPEFPGAAPQRARQPAITGSLPPPSGQRRRGATGPATRRRGKW